MGADRQPHIPQTDPAEQAKVKDAAKRLNDARANIHPGMSRKQRRAAAKKAGVFKYPGLNRHVNYKPKEGGDNA